MYFIQMLLDYMIVKELYVKKFWKVDDYKEDFLKLGKFVFNVFNQGFFFMSYSELFDDLIKKLIDVGLF